MLTDLIENTLYLNFKIMAYLRKSIYVFQDNMTIIKNIQLIINIPTKKFMIGKFPTLIYYLI